MSTYNISAPPLWPHPSRQTIGSHALQESPVWLLSAYDSRTAGYAIRTISGVGGGPREGTPYPDRSLGEINLRGEAEAYAHVYSTPASR